MLIFSGLVAIIFLAMEVTLIIILDSPTFVKAWKLFKKNRPCGSKHKHQARVGDSSGERPNNDVTEVDLEGPSNESIV